MTFQLFFEENPNQNDIQILIGGITDYAKQERGFDALDFFAFFIRDENDVIVGGCSGGTLYGCLHIDSLWVSDIIRNKGWGTKLMNAALTYGKEKSCDFATVNTMDWEALGFYQKLGFKIEFQRVGFHKNSVFYFLRKELLKTTSPLPEPEQLKIRAFTKELEVNIINLYGEEGKKWLANLPLLIAKIKNDHSLHDLKPFKNLSYNYVLSGFKGLKPIVLKLGLDSHSLKREALTLKAFRDFGVVNVLIEEEGMLLLERATPGNSLRAFFPEKDDEAIGIALDCLKRIHQAPIPKAQKFPQINDWLKALDNEFDIPAHYLNKARQLRDELLTTSAAPVLLHGDLHHDNILQNSNGWVVIDPKGVVGESAYDVAAFIRNPIPELLTEHNVSDIINHRIECFAKTLKLSKQRIVDWCYVQSVLAWAWALEDGCDPAYFKKLTELFNR